MATINFNFSVGISISFSFSVNFSIIIIIAITSTFASSPIIHSTPLDSTQIDIQLSPHSIVPSSKYIS
ncbi:hypothetical protein VSDG_08619 [Cytospora chrysosperma]|uniref:Uncharacterized protein n=1 Tax=Cytospora chrysosperma TaxID=252740 RepID=A0A423VFR2_CYTCH|nr:hypothetical protein VSDG_08619 [Valsa sordida]